MDEKDWIVFKDYMDKEVLKLETIEETKYDLIDSTDYYFKTPKVETQLDLCDLTETFELW